MIGRAVGKGEGKLLDSGYKFDSEFHLLAGPAGRYFSALLEGSWRLAVFYDRLQLGAAISTDGDSGQVLKALRHHSARPSDALRCCRIRLHWPATTPRPRAIPQRTRASNEALKMILKLHKVKL